MKEFIFIPCEKIVAKPRMTIGDRWKKRKCVQEYWAFKAHLIKHCKGVEVTGDIQLIFAMPIPKSLSKKKQKALVSTPHMKRPDMDNLLKGFQDAIFPEDGHVWRVQMQKIYSSVPGIFVRFH